MSDSMRITNMPDGGSPARVAYDLMVYLGAFIPKGLSPELLQARFDLYEQCLNLAAGGSGDAKKVLK